MPEKPRATGAEFTAGFRIDDGRAHPVGAKLDFRITTRQGRVVELRREFGHAVFVDDMSGVHSEPVQVGRDELRPGHFP